MAESANGHDIVVTLILQMPDAEKNMVINDEICVYDGLRKGASQHGLEYVGIFLCTGFPAASLPEGVDVRPAPRVFP